MSKNKASVRETVKKLDPVVYCGPSLPQGILQQYTVFKNRLPKHLDDHIKECSSIKALMVKPAELASTRKNISILGTRENKLFNQIIEYAKGVK